MKKGTHGGARPGSGPKPRPERRYISIHLKVPPHQAEWLKQHREKTGQAVNSFIVEAIEQRIKELQGGQS